MTIIDPSAILTGVEMAFRARSRVPGPVKAATCVRMIEEAVGLPASLATRAKMEELLWRDITAVRIAKAIEVLREAHA